MLVNPWDAALDDAEWNEWLGSHEPWGVLAVNNLDRAQAPLVLPLHFAAQGDELLIHLATPNPVWPHLEASEEVRLSVQDDYAYIPGYWRAKPGGPEEDGVPTSYYSAIQFVCRPMIIDDPRGKVEILTAQLGAFQPEGRHASVAVDDPPYGHLLSAIRGVRLQVLRVEAKFKYDDAKSIEHRQRVIGYLQARNHGLDAGAAAQQRRRLSAIGDWRPQQQRR
jgi:transcriptional regulator